MSQVIVGYDGHLPQTDKLSNCPKQEYKADASFYMSNLFSFYVECRMLNVNGYT